MAPRSISGGWKNKNLWRMENLPNEDGVVRAVLANDLELFKNKQKGTAMLRLAPNVIAYICEQPVGALNKSLELEPYN